MKYQKNIGESRGWDGGIISYLRMGGDLEVGQGSYFSTSRPLKKIRRGYRRGECREYSLPLLENGREFSERQGVFFGKIRHNKQKLSINLTSFPFIFDQMFKNSSFQSLFQHNLKGFIPSQVRICIMYNISLSKLMYILNFFENLF